MHPERGAEDLYDGSDYFLAFATFEEALAFSTSTVGAEEPLVLVRQDENINEPEPGQFVHEKGERLAEWRVNPPVALKNHCPSRKPVCSLAAGNDGPLVEDLAGSDFQKTIR